MSVGVCRPSQCRHLQPQQDAGGGDAEEASTDDIHQAAIVHAPFHIDLVVDVQDHKHSDGGLVVEEDSGDAVVRLLDAHIHLDAGAAAPSHFKTTLAALTIVSLVIHLPNSLAGPFLPKEAQSRHVSIAFTGLMFASFFLGVFFSAHAWGRSAASVGYRALIIGGALASGVFAIMFAYVDVVEGTSFFLLVMLFRFLQGIACSATETGATAFLASEYPEEACRVTAYMEASESAGFMLGPALGGVLYDYGGFRLPFIVVGVVIMAAVLPLRLLLPGSSKVCSSYAPVTLWQVFWSPGVPLTAVSAVMGMAVFAFLDPLLQPHFEKHHLSSSVIGMLFTLMSFAYILSTPLVSMMLSSANTTCLLFCGVLISATSLCMLGPAMIPWVSHTLLLQCCSLVLISVGCAFMLVPVVPRMVLQTHHLGHGAAGVVAGLITTSFSLGEIVGPSLGGLFLEYFTFEVSVSLFAGILLCAWTLAFALQRRFSQNAHAHLGASEPLLHDVRPTDTPPA